MNMCQNPTNLYYDCCTRASSSFYGHHRGKNPPHLYHGIPSFVCGSGEGNSRRPPMLAPRRLIVLPCSPKNHPRLVNFGYLRCPLVIAIANRLQLPPLPLHGCDTMMRCCCPLSSMPAARNCVNDGHQSTLLSGCRK